MVVERITYAGKTIEVDKYHINYIPKGPRKKKREESPERIKKANLRKRTDRLRQLMNTNFNDKEFWSMTLTYRKGEEPGSIRQVRNDASDFVTRLRKTAALFGTELKFIYVIGAGKHRRHVHITVNSLPDMAIFRGCWTHGHVSMTPLYSDGQYRDLADYYIKNAQETKEQEEELGEKPGRMFSCSQNLKQPVVEKRIIPGRIKDEPRTIPGYYLEKDSVYKGITSMGFPLIRYTLIKEKQNERDKAVYTHQRRSQHTGQGKSVILASLYKGWRRAHNENRSSDDGRESEVSYPGSHDNSAVKDKRRKRDTHISRMPLSGDNSGHKSGTIRKMAVKWLDEFKRRSNRTRK